MNPETNHIHNIIDMANAFGLKRLAKVWSSRQNADDKDIHIVLLGEFNHGKSSLINALVGENILPYGVTPTTKIDTYIRFDQPERRVTASCCGETVKQWDWPEWQKFCRLIHQEDDIAFDRLDIDLDSHAFDKNCVFIDTPGLNEASLSRENYIERYTSRSDILLFVIDASQALTRSEQAVLKKLASPGVKPHCMMLVVNKCDRLDDEEILDVCAFVEQTVSSLFGNDVFYMVSSRRPDESELPLLRDELLKQYQRIQQDAAHMSQIRQKREMISMMRAFILIMRMISMLEDYQRSSVVGTIHRIPEIRYHVITDEMLEIVSERMNQCVQMARNDISQFCLEFVSAMPREIDKSSVSDVESFFEDYVDDQYSECAKNLKNRLNHQFELLFSDLFECMYRQSNGRQGEFKCPKLDRICDFIEVDHKIHHTVRTGAFDDSRSLFLMDFGLAGTIVGRPSHQRKDALKRMAKNAIERRSEEFILAFAHDLEHFRSMIAITLRETGSQFFAHLLDLMDVFGSNQGISETRLEEADAELSSMLEHLS